MTAKHNIELILKLPGNRSCADCGCNVDADSGWASINLGVVICIQCAGEHRHLGTHITKIRSFRLDTNAWTDKFVRMFEMVGGNTLANAKVWENNFPSFFVNPKIDAGDNIRNNFIRYKYEQKSFVPFDSQLGMKVNCALKTMPCEVRSCNMQFWQRGESKFGKMGFAVIHSRWISAYSSPKKSKANSMYDLTHLKLVNELHSSGDQSFEEYDGYEFCLYEDSDINDHHHHKQKKRNNNNKNINNGDVNDVNDVNDSEPLLRCRVKEYAMFESCVHDIRSIISYYRVYDTLFEADEQHPSLMISPMDMQSNAATFLGYAKFGWSKKWFCVLNGFLFQFKEDVSQMVSAIPKAQNAWNLQELDCELDDNGKRSGAKFCVLLIVCDNDNQNSHTLPLKFNSGPEAVQFYSSLKKAWTAERGHYNVDFAVNPPMIMCEARDRRNTNKMQSVQPNIIREASLPPSVGISLDPQILQYIQQLSSSDPSNTIPISKEMSADVSTDMNMLCDNDMDSDEIIDDGDTSSELVYEHSDEFDLSLSTGSDVIVVEDDIFMDSNDMYPPPPVIDQSHEKKEEYDVIHSEDKIEEHVHHQSADQENDVPIIEIIAATAVIPPAINESMDASIIPSIDDEEIDNKPIADKQDSPSSQTPVVCCEEKQKQQQQKQTPPPNKQKTHKKKKKRKTKHRGIKKTETSTALPYLKLRRFFKISKGDHSIICAKQRVIESELSKQQIMSVNQLRNKQFYIKLQISRRIALPKRKNHWKETLKIVEQNITANDLEISEFDKDL